ncbi:hypothetical protein SARC_07065 [Sphaeroforma arctica JP610]|uniref:OPT family oligopeptide transporter n=1 Tax=Sphaeroforma arctica JP610 TaxID=667725 RepID=A0A0L0FVL7_9EUKA|nr:hypothetical protein SARC_07065 [Sphaeroforma arctica JP610]KNC80581.1 hypothetical protein SARC_07065 [Sphaeroforma arctica JP610]|eukprot:XP_014154483.1 hypothetical protein SARC_07065 [Sphaeroforma arctica JP610]
MTLQRDMKDVVESTDELMFADESDTVTSGLKSKDRKESLTPSHISSCLDGPMGSIKEHHADFEGLPHIQYIESDQSFTWRATVLGSLVGSLIAISNMYLGLKSGITIGATLFATLLGGVTLGPILKMTGNVLGIKEHTCFQAAGTAAGGLNGGLVAPVLVLFWNGFFTGGVGSNIGNLIGLVFGAAGFGLVFAVSLRNFLIVKQPELVFPDGRAAAEILITMYSSEEGAAEGREKTRVMLYCFGVAFVLQCISYFIPILYSVPIFRYLSNCPWESSWQECQADGYYDYFLFADMMGFVLYLDPVFVASAFMVGPSVNIWFLIGAVVGWFILVPIDFNAGYLGETPSFGIGRDHVLMWASVVAMLVCSFSMILINYEVLVDMYKGFKQAITKRNDDDEDEENKTILPEGNERDIDTPIYISASLLALTIGACLAIYMGLFGDELTWAEMILGIAITFPIAVVNAQIMGRTNWNIAALLAKLVMMIMGLMSSTANAMLIVGNMVSQSAAQTAEVSQCYKTGHLVGASPHAQFKAQLAGTAVGGLVSVMAFWLYTMAYPCMLDPEAECIFSMSAARAWDALAEGIEQGVTVGNSLDYTITERGFLYLIIFPCLTVVEGLLFKFVIPERMMWMKPVWTVFFLSWLLPGQYAVAQFFGQCVLWCWQAVAPQQVEMYKFSVAAGLIAGGCVASIATAIFSVFELNGVSWGMGP